MKTIHKAAKFNRELKKIQDSTNLVTLQRLDDTIDLLLDDIPLPAEYKDHPLKGKWEKAMARECHIHFDLLLVYRNTPETLHLLRLGSHSELF